METLFKGGPQVGLDRVEGPNAAPEAVARWFRSCRGRLSSPLEFTGAAQTDGGCRSAITAPRPSCVMGRSWSWTGMIR